MQTVSPPLIKIIEEGIIRSTNDFVRLNVVDWKRFKPYWKSEQHAMDNLGLHFLGMCYTIAKVPMCEYPERDDFPGWQHVGDHESMGRVFWNFFHYIYDGKLFFYDKPDFSGIIYYKDEEPAERKFHGDVGKVSPIAMRETVSAIHDYNIWISMIDENTLILIGRQ